MEYDMSIFTEYLVPVIFQKKIFQCKARGKTCFNACWRICHQWSMTHHYLLDTADALKQTLKPKILAKTWMFNCITHIMYSSRVYIHVCSSSTYKFTIWIVHRSIPLHIVRTSTNNKEIKYNLPKSHLVLMLLFMGKVKPSTTCKGHIYVHTVS